MTEYLLDLKTKLALGEITPAEFERLKDAAGAEGPSEIEQAAAAIPTEPQYPIPLVCGDSAPTGTIDAAPGAQLAAAEYVVMERSVATSRFPKLLVVLAGIGAVVVLMLILSPRADGPVVIVNPPPVADPPPVVNPPPVVHVGTPEERILKYVDRLIATLNRGRIEEVLDLYDDRVDLLTSGIVDKDFIRSALRQYYGLWPNITYTLSGPVSVESLGGGEYRVVYTEDFDVYHPGKAKGIRGTAEEFVKLREYGQSFRITDTKEKVRNSRWY